MLTTWAVLTEAMHLLGAKVGWPGQEALWEFIAREQLEVTEISTSSWGRVRALMAKYRDTPMAIADATLVVVAEERGLWRVFTLDDDFAIYRMGRRRFEIIPPRPQEAPRRSR
jgi:hypothetical protein